MKTPLSLLLCSALPALHAGPFFFGQQGVVSGQSSAPPYSYPSSVIAAFTSTGSGSFSDGAAIDTLTAIAGNVQVFDYDADENPGFPDAKFAELGLAVYLPPVDN